MEVGHSAECVGGVRCLGEWFAENDAETFDLVYNCLETQHCVVFHSYPVSSNPELSGQLVIGTVGDACFEGNKRRHVSDLKSKQASPTDNNKILVKGDR